MRTDLVLGAAIGVGLACLASGQSLSTADRVVMVGDVIDGVHVEAFEQLQLNNHGDLAFQTRSRGPIALIRGEHRLVVADLEPEGFDRLIIGQYFAGQAGLRSLTDAGEVLFFGRMGDLNIGSYAGGENGVRALTMRNTQEPWFGTGLSITRASAIAASTGNGIATWGLFDGHEFVGEDLIQGFYGFDDVAGGSWVQSNTFWIQRPNISVGPSSVIDLNGNGHVLLGGSLYGLGTSTWVNGSLILSIDGFKILVAYEGQDSPYEGVLLSGLPIGHGYFLNDVGEAALSSQGEVLFRASLWSLTGGVTEQTDEVLFLWSGGILTPIVREGDRNWDWDVGSGPAGRFDRNGNVYWHVREAGNLPMPRSSLMSGYGENKSWVIETGSGAADGVGGSVFYGPGEFAFAEDLRLIVYDGRYLDLGGELGTGLWSKPVVSSVGDLSRLLLRSGQRFEIGEGDWRVLQSVELVGSTRGGLITVRLAFEDGSEGVFRLDVRDGRTADLNSDGVLDLGDLYTFVAVFYNNDPAADSNGDGVIDLGDVGAFVEAFLEGG